MGEGRMKYADYFLEYIINYQFPILEEFMKEEHIFWRQVRKLRREDENNLS